MMIEDPARIRMAFWRRMASQEILARRFQLRAARKPHSPPPCRPIFVFGCPRSGTSLLFEMLSSHPDTRSLPGEGHTLWNAYQHPRFRDWISDRVTDRDIAEQERGYLWSAISSIAGQTRFLDKTPKNVLRLPYLAALFPDASFVFIRRDGKDTVASLIEGWRRRRGISYRLPEVLDLQEYRGRFWSYVLPAGWKDMAGARLADVAARQYVYCNETALQDIADIRESSVIHIAYEDLVASPLEEIARIMQHLELGASEAHRLAVKEIASRPIGSVTPPRRDKWRLRGEEIESILPMIAPTMARLGYL